MKFRQVALGLMFSLCCSGLMGQVRREMVTGVSIVAPPREAESTWTADLQSVRAGWVAIMPFALSENGSSKVTFEGGHDWWGLKQENIRKMIQQAHENNLRVFLKPMVRVPGSWAGDYDPGSEKGWQEWETAYRKYILTFARIAESEGVELFAMGTEFKLALRERPAFWQQLLSEIRAEYSGALTYCANWDNYLQVPFWQHLDYIGVDGYFPLTPELSPEVNTLKKCWKKPFKELKATALRYEKQILFTEFGYRSTPGCTWQQWEIESRDPREAVDLQAQVNGYQSVFETFWEEEWFAGGFIWNWHLTREKAGGKGNSDYTPQQKPVVDIIAKWFGNDLP